MKLWPYILMFLCGCAVQKPEVGSRKSEVRSQKSEVRPPTSAPLFQAMSRAQPASVIQPPPPAPAATIRLLPGDVNLTWLPALDESGEASAASYNLYYGAASRSYTTQIPAGTNLSVTVSNLVIDQTYYVAATAVDVQGIETDFSTELIFTNEQEIELHFPEASIGVESSHDLVHWQDCPATFVNGNWRVKVGLVP